MKNVTVRLSEEKVDELDEEADELGVSRAEYIRSLIESRHESAEVEDELERLQREYEREIEELKAEHQSEIDGLKSQYEDEIEDLENEIEYLNTQVERLQRTNLKILEERDRTTDLEVYVDERREWERASWFTRQKWKLFGRE